MNDEKTMPVDPLGERDPHDVMNKESDKNYRWVIPSKWSKRQMQGYRPVPKDSPVIAGSHASPEGYRMLGHKTLMECPAHMREMREKRSLDKDRQRRLDTKDRFHALGDKLGVQTFEFDRVPKRGGGHEDVEVRGASGRQKQFSMGAGINPQTGEVERAEQPPTGSARRTMLGDLTGQDDADMELPGTEQTE